MDIADLLVIACKTLVNVVSFLGGRVQHFAKKCSVAGVQGLETAFKACLLLNLRFLVTSSVLGAMLRPALGRLTLLKNVIILEAVLSMFLGGRVGRLRDRRGWGDARGLVVCAC